MSMNSITFKSLTEDDLNLLHQWFQLPHVLKWYARSELYTLTMIQDKYRPRINDQTIRSFIIYDARLPVGYIQLYQVAHHLPEGMDALHPLFHQYKRDALAGIDVFIADKTYLGTGFSDQAFNLFLDQYAHDQFRGVLVDPLKTNTFAIAFFKRHGFTAIESHDAHHVVLLLLL